MFSFIKELIIDRAIKKKEALESFEVDYWLMTNDYSDAITTILKRANVPKCLVDKYSYDNTKENISKYINIIEKNNLYRLELYNNDYIKEFFEMDVTIKPGITDVSYKSKFVK